MTYVETLNYLYARLPMYSRIGAAAYRENLGNIIALCDALSNPQHSLRCIHIAGTNGKGSTSHMLAAILQKSGYKTGLYTSPHIYDFRERIRIDGEMISEQFIIDFTESIKEICRQIEPSFFEVTVAMAFAWFAQNKIDYAVIETGLGGKLDSTNIITPILSVITNIGYDHMDILGNTLEKIAAEKAGIIKQYIPVVIGETIAETKPVFEGKAHQLSSKCIFSEDEWLVEYIESTDNLLICHFKDVQTGVVEKIQSGLKGLYQVNNIRTVLSAVKELRNTLSIPEEAVHNGIDQVKKLTGIFGRWEIIESHPTVVLDVAHNKEGILEIVNQLNINHPGANFHFIVGFVKEKNMDELFTCFPEKSVFYFTQAHIPRALPHEELKTLAAIQGVKGESFDDVNDAIFSAKKAATEKDVIIVCGSFFVISEVKIN